MKAVYDGEGITLESNVRFLRRDGESTEDFVQRVRGIVEEDYCAELVLEEVEPTNSDRPTPAREEPKISDPKDDNVGKTCSFVKRNSGKVVHGQIIWLYPDKRKNLLYYRVKDGMGKIHIVRINNKTLQIQ